MCFWFCLVSSADDVDSNSERFPWKTSSVFSFLRLISLRKSTFHMQNGRRLKTTALKIGVQCCHNYSKLVPCKHVTWELPAGSPTCQQLPWVFIVDCSNILWLLQKWHYVFILTSIFLQQDNQRPIQYICCSFPALPVLSLQHLISITVAEELWWCARNCALKSLPSFCSAKNWPLPHPVFCLPSPHERTPCERFIIATGVFKNTWLRKVAEF